METGGLSFRCARVFVVTLRLGAAARNCAPWLVLGKQGDDGSHMPKMRVTTEVLDIY